MVREMVTFREQQHRSPDVDKRWVASVSVPVGRRMTLTIDRDHDGIYTMYAEGYQGQTATYSNVTTASTLRGAKKVATGILNQFRNRQYD